MHGLAQDFQLAVRLLIKDRRFTSAAALALGLGIGLNTAVFSIVNAAVLRDVPFDAPDRLIAIQLRDARGTMHGASYADLRDWRAQSILC